ncbi:hypothetical protein ACFLRM_04750 [Acidobacteriota bacterium]
MPTIKKLSNPRYFPYRYGQSVWAYITGKWGDQAVEEIMKSASKTGNLAVSIKNVLKISVEDLSKEWQAALKKAYEPILEKAQSTDSPSRILFKGNRQNMLNIAPALSPDGSRIIFLSTKDLFSIDLFLADTKSGAIIKKLVSTATDPHFESLHFIKSAGAWDAEGKRFAFGAIIKGKPVLSIINVETSEKEKEIPFSELEEVLNPTWSPDNRFIAFTAQVGGFTDLFIYDLQSDELRRITNDPFAELQPAWSPDGKTIALVTDRFTTNLQTLSYGKFQVALLDLESNTFKKLTGFQAKSINPQWDADAKHLFFLSDWNGISNIYRITLETGKIDPVTNLYTGVSGITEMSPAFSIASDVDKLAFSSYENDVYNIYTNENLDVLDESIRYVSLRPDILPPREKPDGMLTGLLRNPIFGLPSEDEYETKSFKPKMKLDYISPPVLSIGTDRYGTYGGGGVMMSFSNMLGYHNISGTVQVSTRLLDSAALVTYQNNKNRLSWGLTAYRIPYITGGFAVGFGEVGGEPVRNEQELIFRQINHEVSVFASYPFSQVKRFQLSVGYRYLDFDQELRERSFSLIDGVLLSKSKEKLPAPQGLNFGFGSAALVYDTSLFGATAPILGQSYRLEISPFLGDISYFTLLADFRRYFMPVRPFTLAFRFLHYGRYGGNADDSRLPPLFLGYETLVRGYGYTSFSAAEASSGQGGDVFQRLF